MSEEAATVSPIQPDLEKLRDEKVVPVARDVLKDIADSMPTTDLNPNTDFTQLLISILTRSLEADLNLTTENPYIFQLVLGQFASFNTIAGKSKKAESQDDRFARIGSRMMALMVKANAPMGTDVKPADQEAAFEVIQPELEQIFLSENLTDLEVGHILEGMLRALKTTEQIFSGNVERSVRRMEAKILDIEDMTDLSMKKLDETLQKDIAEIRAGKVE